MPVLVFKVEEKGSDVNLASHLLFDAFRGAFDAAAVLSNDSDLVEPIRIVTKELSRFPEFDQRTAAVIPCVR